MNWNCRFPVPKAAHGAGLSGQVFKDKNGAITGFIRPADEGATRFRVSDTAHRAASLRARELASWMPLLGSADSDLLSELPTLVSRSRDLTRNHGVAAGAIQTLVDNVIGTGLRLAAIPDYRALGKNQGMGG
jgi:capsid protein